MNPARELDRCMIISGRPRTGREQRTPLLNETYRARPIRVITVRYPITVQDDGQLRAPKGSIAGLLKRITHSTKYGIGARAGKALQMRSLSGHWVSKK